MGDDSRRVQRGLTDYDIRPDEFNEGDQADQVVCKCESPRILDFAMPWDSSSSLGGGIVVDAVLGPFAVENTTIRFQVANQVMALHWDPLGDGNRYLFASDFLARNPLPS